MAFLTTQQTMGLAQEHYRAGRHLEAETLCRQLLARAPDDVEAMHLLGLSAYGAGRFAEGAEWMQRSIARRPGVAGYHNNLGLLLGDWGRLEESADALETARRLAPGTADIHFNLGNTRLRQRQWDAAVAAFRTAVELDPRFVKAWLNLGATLSANERYDEALESCRSALRICPGDPTLLVSLGNILREMGKLDEAIEAYRGALARVPDEPAVLNNLANAFKDRGEIAEALAALRKSLAARPRPDIHSNLILTCHFDSSGDANVVRNEERKWNELHTAPLRSQRRPHLNDRSTERRLRIGYVSADLRNHAVGRTLLPVFEAHDRTQVECVCYAGVATDPVAERFRASADHWRNMETWSDAQLAAQIQADRVDILIDLGLHTAGNQLPAFARKPAPIQVSWLGYPGSSGVETIDYYLTDRFLHPAGEESAESSGRPFFLPDAWCCYPAPEDSPEVGALPALSAGHVTFASFNNFAKINAHVVALWTRILHSIPHSRLLLLARTGAHETRIRAAFSAEGIDSARVEFLDFVPVSAQRSPADYLRRYVRADVALDPFPYNGMTTSGDALWMGVPVVALRGGTSFSRATFSLLSNVGLPELAASTEEEYVQIATSLAGDFTRLAELRATLRDRMRASPLLDAARFARNLEAAYRTLWREWCIKAPDA